MKEPKHLINCKGCKYNKITGFDDFGFPFEECQAKPKDKMISSILIRYKNNLYCKKFETKRK